MLPSLKYLDNKFIAKRSERLEKLNFRLSHKLIFSPLQKQKISGERLIILWREIFILRTEIFIFCTEIGAPGLAERRKPGVDFWRNLKKCFWTLPTASNSFSRRGAASYLSHAKNKMYMKQTIYSKEPRIQADAFSDRRKTSALLLSLYLFIYKVGKRQDVAHHEARHEPLWGLNLWKRNEKMRHGMRHTMNHPYYGNEL